MIGGSGRNVGKTTLICAIIRKFAPSATIIGLKVTSIRPGEDDFHGYHDQPLSENFRIFEETNIGSAKDTARMLKAGARKAYFIQSTDEHLPLAMEAFFKLVDKHSTIICETRSLRRYIKPGIFVLITDPSNGDFKDKAAEFEGYADIHIRFDTLQRIIELQADRIGLNAGKWHISDEK